MVTHFVNSKEGFDGLWNHVLPLMRQQRQRGSDCRATRAGCAIAIDRTTGDPSFTAASLFIQHPARGGYRAAYAPGASNMRLPSHLKRSRHGVFYYRIVLPAKSVSTAACRTTDMAWSLGTRDPGAAAVWSRELSARLLRVLPSLRVRAAGDHGAVGASIRDALVCVTEWITQLRSGGADRPNLPAFAAIAWPAPVPAPLPTHRARDSALGDDPFGPVEDATVPMGPRPAVVVPSRTSLADTIQYSLSINRATRVAKTQQEYARFANDFAEWLEEREVDTFAAVATGHIAEYKKHLIDDRHLSPKTVNKWLTAIGTLFRDAKAAGHYPLTAPLPTTGHLYTKKAVARSVKSWLPLSAEDLLKVFDPVVFGAFGKPHEYWVPLLMVHHGLRVSEASQLSTADVRQQGACWTLTITDEGEHASVKTEASIRTVPLHPALVRLGLLTYIQDVRRVAGEGLLFPYLRCDSVNGFGDVPGESLNRYLKRCLNHPRKRGHSCRHTVNEMLKQGRVSEETRCEFVGHEHDTINSSVYAGRLAADVMAEIVFPILQFPLDYERLACRGGRFDKVLVSELRRRRRHLARNSRTARE